MGGGTRGAPALIDSRPTQEAPNRGSEGNLAINCHIPFFKRLLLVFFTKQTHAN